MRLKHTDLLGAFFCVPCLAMPALAADPAPSTTGNELEEVIITAERRTTDIQKVAASVTVRTGDELDEQGRYTTRQILEDIPGFVAADNNSRNNGSTDVQGNNLTIRGISPGPGAAGGAIVISPAAGAAVYVDGVYEGIGSGYDIERVEALRGPQGTLYGRSATTGVVGFHTRNPSMDGFAGSAAVEAGNYDVQHYTAAVNIPLADSLAVRVSGDYFDQGDGYYGAATRGVSTRTNGRVKLLWEPTDTFSLLTGIAYEKLDSLAGGTSYTATLPSFAITTTNAVLAPGLKETRQYWAEANLDIGPLTLIYLPSFRSWEQDDVSIATQVLGTTQNRRTTQTTPKDHFLTHELRVTSRDETALQWQAGVFYYRNTLTSSLLARYESPAGVPGAVTSASSSVRDTHSVGYFAETTIPLTDSLRATLGARYDDTKIGTDDFLLANDYMNCGNQIGLVVPLPPGVTCTGLGTANGPPPTGVFIPGLEVDSHSFSYKARLEYDLTPKNMLYGMISTAFRPGDVGINAMTRLPNVLGTEKLTSIEFGSKNRFLDDSLQVNVGVFDYKYHEDGFRTFYQPNVFVAGVTVSLNVPLHNFGGEMEMLYRLTPNDRIGLNFNYVESRWKDKPAGFLAAQPEIKRALTPYTITANYQHMFNFAGGSTLSARIDGRYEASRLGSDLHAQYLALGLRQYVELGARTIGNLSANWASDGGRYSISAYVRNFTDVRYTSYGVTTNTPTQGRLGVTWSDPRTYGAQVSVRF